MIIVRTVRHVDSRRCSLALVSGEGPRRAGEGTRPADCDQGPKSRHPPHNLANYRRPVRDRPPDLLVTDDGVVARRELAGLRLIHRRPKGVSRLVPGEGLSMRGCKGSPLRRARRERRLWQPDRRPRVRLREPPRQESAVALPACPRARRPGCPRLPGADGRGSLRLKQRQHPLGAIGSPEPDKAAVFFAQRHPVGFGIHHSHP